jgi:hypothetical protein
MSRLGIVVAGAISLSMVALAVYSWISLGDVGMSLGGYLALIGGGVAVVALGAGLMGLVFYSNRTGFDAEVGSVRRLNDPPPPSRERANGHNPDRAA